MASIGFRSMALSWLSGSVSQTGDTVVADDVRFRCQDFCAVAIQLNCHPFAVFPSSMLVSRGFAFAVKSVADHAFSDSSSKSIVIPASVENLGSAWFSRANRFGRFHLHRFHD
jgi:hypothetical protein